MLLTESPLKRALRWGLTYATGVLLSVAWPSLLLLKVLPPLAHASGSPFWSDLLDNHGSLLLGGIACLALGDFFARRHPGRAAFQHASIAFGLVFVLSLGVSVLWHGSFVHVYGLLWPPHLLAVLAGVWLGQRTRFHRLSLFAGLVCWPLAALVSLYFLGSVLRLTWLPPGVPLPLLVLCLLVLLLAVGRTVKGVRWLLA